MKNENEIVKVTLTLQENRDWRVDVLKNFAPEHGGGSQTFSESGGPQIHRALDVARGMVTMHPGQRTDLVEVQFATMVKVTEILAKGGLIGMPANVEHPGYISVGKISFGTANPKWGWSDEDGNSGEFEIDSHSQDAQVIADAILETMRERLEIDANNCACGGTGAVPAHPTSSEEYDACPDCAIRFPHSVEHGVDGDSCLYCGQLYPDGPCPASNHPNRKKQVVA